MVKEQFIIDVLSSDLTATRRCHNNRFIGYGILWDRIVTVAAAAAAAAVAAALPNSDFPFEMNAPWLQ